VLLVDDNAAGMAARRMVLEELGYATEGVTCPMEALSLFRKAPYDVVITDYKMPGMTGRELISALREIEPAVPVILISGYVEALGLSEKNTGATVVLMKCANEVQHLVRSVQRVTAFKPPPRPARKPPSSAGPKAKARKRAASS